VGCRAHAKSKRGGKECWAGFAGRPKERERGERKEKPFSFSDFCKLAQIQTKFEFKPLNTSSTLKQKYYAPA
jgi:hypothetical protein